MMVSIIGIEVISYDVEADTTSDAATVFLLGGIIDGAIFLWAHSDGLKDAQVANDQIAGQNYMTNVEMILEHMLSYGTQKLINEQNLYNLILVIMLLVQYNRHIPCMITNWQWTIPHLDYGTVLPGLKAITDLMSLNAFNIAVYTTVFDNYNQH